MTTTPQDAAVAMSAMWALGMFTTALVLSWRRAYPPRAAR